jgi:hypothetical protein
MANLNYRNKALDFYDCSQQQQQQQHKHQLETKTVYFNVGLLGKYECANIYHYQQLITIN